MPPKSTTMKKVNKRNRKLLSPAESLSQDDDDTTFDAILVTRSELGVGEEMKKDAKDALEQELHVEDVRGELFVGNLRGLSFANYKVDQADLRARVDAQDKKIASLEVKNASLEDRVSSLTSSLDAYKLLRNRFISTFKRDKLANATEVDRRIIAEGNGWAHGGDAIVDAELYQGMGGRRDPIAFKKLYGMSPGDVRMISGFFTILKKCWG